MPVSAHCEDEPTIRRNSEIQRTNIWRRYSCQSAPSYQEPRSLFHLLIHAINLAKEYNTRLHIFHLSTADEMKLFSNEMPLSEKRITGEVCVHHLWFDDSDYEKLGTRIKWNPAIKTKFDREGLIDGVNNDRIDIIATDHAPHTIEEKSNSYFKAPSGGPLVQHSLVIMLELWHKKVISLEKIVEKMCHNPAILFNIRERGFIREGYKADLCLVDPDNEWSVSKENIFINADGHHSKGQPSDQKW